MQQNVVDIWGPHISSLYVYTMLVYVGCRVQDTRSARVFEYTVYRGIQFQVYSVFMLKIYGQKSWTSNFMRLTFRLSSNALNRWFSWWFRAHIIWKNRVVKYDDVCRQINVAVQKYCENEKWRWCIYRKSFQTRGFGENLDDFWPRYCRAMKRNWNCVTCLPFFSGLSCFWQPKGKVKFNIHAEDQMFYFYFYFYLANYVESSFHSLT